MAYLKLEDIINVGFHKSNIGGYKAEEVDMFIDSVQETFEQKKKETDDLKKKLAILARKVEQYRTEEESIKSTLLNAQKLADASVREAKHKAEVILKDAEDQAHSIVGGVEDSYDQEVESLKNMKSEVVKFRSQLLDIYKEHLRLIDALPREEDLKEQSKEETVQELEVKLDVKNELDKSQEFTIESFENVVAERTEEIDIGENAKADDEEEKKTVELTK